MVMYMEGESIAPQIFQLVLQADTAPLWVKHSEKTCLGTHALQKIRRLRNDTKAHDDHSWPAHGKAEVLLLQAWAWIGNVHVEYSSCADLCRCRCIFINVRVCMHL